jgi:hypothetical protein
VSIEKKKKKQGKSDGNLCTVQAVEAPGEALLADKIDSVEMNVKFFHCLPLLCWGKKSTEGN